MFLLPFEQALNASGAVFVGTLAFLIGSGMLASSTSSVVTTVNANSPTCVVEVPDSVSIGSWSNSTMQGSAVTFSNGTEIVFPADTCVRPVHPSIYALDLAVESNANFTRAENGSRFAPPASYETCSQFAGQPAGTSGVVCPPQGATFATAYPPFSCPGGASNVTQGTDCAPYVMLGFGLFGRTLITPCPNEVTVNELQELIVYVRDSNGTFDTSSVLVQTDTTPVIHMCTTITTTTTTTTTTSSSLATSTAQSSQTVEGSSSTNATSQGTAISQSVSSAQRVGGGQPAILETIVIAAAVAVVTGAMVMTRRRRG
jgi:hypothetical protein